MHRLARTFFAIAVMQFIFCAGGLMVLTLPWSLILATAVVAHASRFKQSFAHGSAKWASEVELRRTGLVGNRRGLEIGYLPDALPETWGEACQALFDKKIPDAEANERLFIRVLLGIAKKQPRRVRLTNCVHTAVFGPTGMGKGSSFIVPWLLSENESAVVLDFKGENASLTAAHRERVFKHRCVLLDPFHVMTAQPDSYNPIDFIEAASPQAIDDCRDLAEQLVVRGFDEREPHWSDSAEAWICAAIAAVVEHSKTNNRSLQTVREVLSNPEHIPKLIELLRGTQGMFARIGSQLSYYRDKELSSTLTTANRHLRFLDTPAIAASTATSSFDPKELRSGKMTVFCILPPQHMRSQAALIRLWIGGLMRAVVQEGLQRG